MEKLDTELEQLIKDFKEKLDVEKAKDAEAEDSDEKRE